MTVNAFKKHKPIFRKPMRQQSDKEFMFIFENSHALLQGVLFLCRRKTSNTIKSDLYSLKNRYCLIIYSKDEKPYFLHLKEFCQPDFPFSKAYTKEYGKPLINGNAVKKLCEIFFKGI